MQDTTDLQAPPAGLPMAGGFPPPPPMPPAHVGPPNLISQAAPSLPQMAPAVPRPAPAPEANPFASSMNDHWAPAPAAARPKQRGAARRRISWLLVLAVLGGLAYGGIMYGSDLMKLATGDDSIDEPAAPLVFPSFSTSPVPVRTASFTIERPDALQGPQTYEVTMDFESGISRVVIDRTDAPNIEILTLWDAAFIRRVDDPTWYRFDRGQFPIDSELGVGRWVRTLNQILPPAIRQSAVIERVTQSSVGTEATTRMLISIDPAVISLATAPQSVPSDPAVTAAPVAATPPDAAPAPAPDAAPAPAPDAVPAPAAAAFTLPPGMMLQPGTDEAPTLTMELWIDTAGIVRKSIMPVELGAETITITSLSPDPWQPIFPTEDMVQPLTAMALFKLGL